MTNYLSWSFTVTANIKSSDNIVMDEVNNLDIYVPKAQLEKGW